MTSNHKTGLHAMQYKTIDGLQIRFATSDKTRRAIPSCCLALCRKAFLLFSRRGTCSRNLVRW